MSSYLDFINSDVAGLIFLFTKFIVRKSMIYLSDYEPFKIAFSNKYIFTNKLIHDHPWIDLKFNDISQKFKNIDYRVNIFNYDRIMGIITIVIDKSRKLYDDPFIVNLDIALFSKIQYYIPELATMKINDNNELGIFDTSGGIRLAIGNFDAKLYYFNINRKVADNIIFSYYLL